MASTALDIWHTSRTARLDRLQLTHAAIGGMGAGHRLVTEELNHALILRLAAEFQGFARDLHNEAAETIGAELASGVAARERALLHAFTSSRRLGRGNATADTLRYDFQLLGLDLWDELEQRYPAQRPRWRERLEWLNTARNGLAHSDPERIERVVNAGWPPTLRSARRWRSTLEQLAVGMDRVTGEHIAQVFGTTA